MDTTQISLLNLVLSTGLNVEIGKKFLNEKCRSNIKILFFLCTEPKLVPCALASINLVLSGLPDIA